MICRDCPAGRRITRNDHRCVVCIPYGMILKEDHECQREGWRDFERDEDHRAERGQETGLQEDGGGAPGEVREFYQDPKNEEAFQRWKAERRQQHEAAV